MTNTNFEFQTIWHRISELPVLVIKDYFDDVYGQYRCYHISLYSHFGGFSNQNIVNGVCFTPFKGITCDTANRQTTEEMQW